MHIVISGYYGFDNVGDEAILFSIIKNLRYLDSKINITVLTNDPESTKAMYGVNAVNRWKLKEISNVLKTADGLISGGGSLLQDTTGLKSIPYYTGIMRIAMMHGVPVFVYAQGMGPIHKSFNKWLVSSTLNKATGITVRDESSRQLLIDIGVNKEIIVVPDPVIGLDGSLFSTTWLRQQHISKPIVAVSVRDWPSEINFKERIARALDRLARRNYSIVFVPMHGVHDYKTSMETAALMKNRSFIAPGNISIGEKISIIGQANLLIGMRLHALIFSAITATPFIALSYDPKIDAFASIAEQPVAGHVCEDGWDDKSLTELALSQLADEKRQAAFLKEKIGPMKKSALKTTELAMKMFTEKSHA